MVQKKEQKNNGIKSIFKRAFSVGGKKDESIKKEKTKKIIQDIKKDHVKKVLVRKTSKKIKHVISDKKINNIKTKKTLLKKKKILSKKVEKKEEKAKKESSLKLKKVSHNPILSPSLYGWESQAVFNPAAVLCGGIVHLFYRALGEDGISRIGYAQSYDGINFKERLTYPVYYLTEAEDTKNHWPFTSPARPVYDTSLYSSGGGWGGCEDPRTVTIDGVVYMTLNIFNGWGALRVAVVSIKEEDLLKKKWNWNDFSYLSRLGDRQKNWVLFPEKINGKFAIFCNLDKGDPNRVFVTYVNKLDSSETPFGKDAPDPQRLPDHIVSWHKRTRSAACPPIKTKDGWLLLYHAMDKDGSDRYKLGVMLLDLKDPQKILYRSQNPILEPNEWYENDWKPGIIYANGAVVKNGKLFVYYGGGDKYVCVASIQLSELLDSLKSDKIIKLKNIKSIKIK